MLEAEEEETGQLAPRATVNCLVQTLLLALLTADSWKGYYNSLLEKASRDKTTIFTPSLQYRSTPCGFLGLSWV